MNYTEVLKGLFEGLILSAERKNNYYSGYQTLVMKLSVEDELIFALHRSKEEPELYSISHYSFSREDYSSDWEAKYDPRFLKTIKKGYYMSTSSKYIPFISKSVKDIFHNNKGLVKIIVDIDTETGIPTIVWLKDKGLVQ